ALPGAKPAQGRTRRIRGTAMNEACQRYLEDPERNGAHLRECAECRAVFDALGLEVDARPIAVDDLPMASWEGAAHRPWALVVAGAVAVAALAIVLFI